MNSQLHAVSAMCPTFVVVGQQEREEKLVWKHGFRCQLREIHHLKEKERLTTMMMIAMKMMNS